MAELTEEQKRIFKNAFNSPQIPQQSTPQPEAAPPGLFSRIFGLLPSSSPAPVVGPDNAELTDEQKKIFRDAFGKRGP